VCNAPASPTFPGNQCPVNGFVYVQSVSFCANEKERYFHVDGITVNKINQTVESALAGATMHVSCSPALLFRSLA
jgi:hypothetical protein